jgi:hypothetical protein
MPAGSIWTDISGSFQNSTARTSPAKCQGGDGTSAVAPRGDRGAVNPLSITRPHHRRRISRALFRHAMVAFVLFPTLGQTCEDLVVCAHPTSIRNRLDRAPSPICSMLRSPLLGRGETTTGSKATNAGVPLQARAATRVYRIRSDE